MFLLLNSTRKVGNGYYCCTCRAVNLLSAFYHLLCRHIVVDIYYSSGSFGKCRASSIPIFSYFLTKFLFFREIPIFSYFLAILHLILVFYSLLITILWKNIPENFLASLHSASKYFCPYHTTISKGANNIPPPVIITKGSLIAGRGAH